MSEFGALIRYGFFLIGSATGFTTKRTLRDLKTSKLEVDNNEENSSAYYLNLGVGLTTFLLILFLVYFFGL